MRNNRDAENKHKSYFTLNIQAKVNVGNKFFDHYTFILMQLIQFFLCGFYLIIKKQFNLLAVAKERDYICKRPGSDVVKLLPPFPRNLSPPCPVINFKLNYLSRKARLV